MIEDIFRSLFNSPPSHRRVELDIDEMKEETKEWRNSLYPWIGANELGIVSLNHESKMFKQKVGKARKGVYHSIYNEPMIVFGYKNYLRRGTDTLIWASTKNHEFIYRGKKDRTNFYIDGESVGFITRDHLMYGGSRNRLLGRRNDFNEDHYSIVIWDKEVTHLLKQNKPNRVNPRAFELLEKIGPKEELLLIALGFLTVLEDAFEIQGAKVK